MDARQALATLQAEIAVAQERHRNGTLGPTGQGYVLLLAQRAVDAALAEQGYTVTRSESELDHIAWAQHVRAEHEATHGEAEMCGAECIVLGLAEFDDAVTRSDAPDLRAAIEAVVNGYESNTLRRSEVIDLAAASRAHRCIPDEATLDAIFHETALPPKPTQYRRGWADAHAAIHARLREATDA